MVGPGQISSDRIKRDSMTTFKETVLLMITGIFVAILIGTVVFGIKLIACNVEKVNKAESPKSVISTKKDSAGKSFPIFKADRSLEEYGAMISTQYEEVVFNHGKIEIRVNPKTKEVKMPKGMTSGEALIEISKCFQEAMRPRQDPSLK